MRNLPRFGHTSDFALLWGNEAEKSDYIYGLLFGGIFIISFFLVWTILIPIFKCLGQRKVGFLSGSPFQVPRGSKKPRIIRSAYIIAAIIMVVFSVLLVTKGLTQIETGVNTVYSSSVAFNEIIGETEQLVDKLNTWVVNAIPLRDEFVSQLTNFCQGTNLTAETGTEFDAITQNVTSFLNDLGNFSQDYVEELKYGLDNASDSSSNAVETTEKITLESWESLIFIIPFSIFFTALVAGVLLAWFDRSNKRFSFFLSWVILPLFFISIIICYVLAGGIAMSASANAGKWPSDDSFRVQTCASLTHANCLFLLDFCSGGTENTPQATLLEIMGINGYSEDDIQVRALSFYIQVGLRMRADAVISVETLC
jgi:glycopeptide antibiotics resistance protein